MPPGRCVTRSTRSSRQRVRRVSSAVMRAWLAVFVLLSAPALAQRNPGGPFMPPMVNTDNSVHTDTAPDEPWHFVGAQVGVGAAFTAFSLPITIALASNLGTLSANLIGAALPPVLLLAFAPPA